MRRSFSGLVAVALRLCSSRNKHRLQVTEALGFPGRPSPFSSNEDYKVAVDHFPDVQKRALVEEVEFFLLTKESAKRRAQQNGRRSKRCHRLIVICPACTREVPIGRYHQHASVHADKEIAS